MSIKTDILDKLTPDAIKEMQRIWFTADLHAQHPKMVDICNRPTTREEQDEWLLKEVFNKHVQKNEEVYILGDVSLGKRQDAEKWVARMNGNKHLILGNHDKNVAHLGNWCEITQIKDFTFSRFGVNIHIVLCHYPMLSWNRRIHGSWHLFGHEHCRNIGHVGFSFDVGIDRIGLWRPYNLYEICKIMHGKELAYTEEDIIKSSFNI
jgi:calcineurin-like phosphoesterase family protein